MSNQKDYDFFLKNDDLSKYSGEWIAICNQEIIFHNIDGEKVMKASLKRCKERPLFIKVPTQNQAMIL